MLLYVSVYNTWKIAWQMKAIKSMLVSCVNSGQRFNTARCHWNRMCQIRGQDVRFSQWCWWRFKSSGKLHNFHW